MEEARSLIRCWRASVLLDVRSDVISSFREREVFHIAERDPSLLIVGFQNVKPFATYTDAFAHVGVIGTYVDPSAHRQGIGRLLFESTRLAARDKGYEKCCSLVSGLGTLVYKPAAENVPSLLRNVLICAGTKIFPRTWPIVVTTTPFPRSRYLLPITINGSLRQFVDDCTVTTDRPALLLGLRIASQPDL